MIIGGVGRVGIGSTGPSAQLDILHGETPNGEWAAKITNNDTQANDAYGLLITAANGTAGAFQVRNQATTTLLKVQGDGKVGIGTTALSASAAKLQIELANTTSVYNVAQNGLVLRNVSNNDDNQINMAFMSSHATTISAYIGMHSTNTGASTGNLLFATNPDGTAPADRMIITSAGKVGIGTTAPDNLLHLKKTSGSVYQKIESDDDSVGLIFDGVKASGYPTGVAIIQFKNDGDDVAKISADATADDAANLAFHTQAASGSLTQRMVIEGSGALTLTTAKLSVSLSGSDTLILGT